MTEKVLWYWFSRNSMRKWSIFCSLRKYGIQIDLNRMKDERKWSGRICIYSTKDTLLTSSFVTPNISLSCFSFYHCASSKSKPSILFSLWFHSLWTTYWMENWQALQWKWSRETVLKVVADSELLGTVSGGMTSRIWLISSKWLLYNTPLNLIRGLIF